MDTDPEYYTDEDDNSDQDTDAIRVRKRNRGDGAVHSGYPSTFDHVVQIRYHIREYAKLFERVYGRRACYPILHFAQHLPECVLNYGPVRSVSAWKMERDIGWMKGIAMNRHHPERQVFRQWLIADRLTVLPYLSGEFGALDDDQKLLLSGLQSGDVRSTPRSQLKIMTVAQLQCAALANQAHVTGSEIFVGKLMGILPGVDRRLSLRERAEMKDVLLQLYSNAPKQVTDIVVSDMCRRCHRLQWNNVIIGTQGTRYERSSWVMMRSGTRICPVQCLLFLEVHATITTATSSVSLPHYIVKVRLVGCGEGGRREGECAIQ